MEEALLQAHYITEVLQISNNIPHLQSFKRMVLRARGYSDQEIDRLCEPKEYDREEVMRAVGEINAQYQKEMDKLNGYKHKSRAEPKSKNYVIGSELSDEQIDEIVQRAKLPDFNPKP